MASTFCLSDSLLSHAGLLHPICGGKRTSRRRNYSSQLLQRLIEKHHFHRQYSIPSFQAAKIDAGTHGNPLRIPSVPRIFLILFVKHPFYKSSHQSAFYIIDLQTRTHSFRQCERNHRRRIERIRVVLLKN